MDAAELTTINDPDYIVNGLSKEIRRIRQHKALHRSAGVWQPENHPELVHGGAAFIGKTRSERDERFENALDRHSS